MGSVAVSRPGRPARYAGALLALILAVGAWLLLPLSQKRWEENARREQLVSATEQSLDALDSVGNPEGAPGAPARVPAEGEGGAYARKPASAESGAPQGSAGKSAPSSSPAAAPPPSQASSLGAALRALARSGGAGREERASRTAVPFLPPRAGFAGLSGLGASGSSSSSQAGLSARGLSAFAPGGGNPERFQAADPEASAGPAARAPRGRNTALGLLQGVQAAARQAALSAGAEKASGLGGEGYDGSASRPALAAEPSARGEALLSRLDAAPANLKAEDLDRFRKKGLEPPKLAEPKEAPDQGQQLLGGGFMQLLLKMLIGGLLAPALGLPIPDSGAKV